MTRSLCTTKVMNINKQYPLVLQLLCSAFRLMAKARRNFISLAVPQCLLKFHKDSLTVSYHQGEQRCANFNKLPRSDVSILVALGDLGRGEHGKAWLCVTQTYSAVCVLKFDNKHYILDRNFQREKMTWHLLYPEFKDQVQVQVWSGAHALIMPHFATVLNNEQDNYKEELLVVLTAIAESRRKGKFTQM